MSILLAGFMLLVFANHCQAQTAQAPQSTKSENTTPPLRIAVSANFTPTLKNLLIVFTKETGIKVQIISASSGTLYLQIKHGAPFDVFLSADAERPKKLQQAGLVVPNTRHTYALGELALFTTKKAPLTVNNLKQWLSTQPQRFAIANPKLAPYGQAAKAVLIQLSLWQSFKDHLVIGQNINQTFQQVRSHNVSGGIVAHSQLIANGLSGELMPKNLYPAIEQQMVILKSSKQQNAAKKLQHFLLSPTIQKNIKTDGYGIEADARVKNENESVIKGQIEAKSTTSLKGSERERH